VKVLGTSTPRVFFTCANKKTFILFAKASNLLVSFFFETSLFFPLI